MCATVQVWETLADAYDKVCKATCLTATFSYGEKADFMGDGHVRLHATVTPKFISKIEPALRRKQQLQMAAAICRLGGTVFLNGAVTRVQSNTESLFNNLIKEIQNMTEHNTNVYPVRTDVPIKIQDTAGEQPKPHTNPHRKDMNI